MFETLETYPGLLAIAIFLARIADVSLGTVRSLVGFRGYRALSALIGFFEALIWVLAVRQVLVHLDARPWLSVAYAGGFAVGTFIGISLERALGVGQELIRAISYRLDVNLADGLREHGYHVVELQGTRRNQAPVQVLYVVERRRAVPILLRRLRELDEQAIYTVTDVKTCTGEEPEGPMAQNALRGSLRK
ncbi:MAG: DUF5698 domain-containing protein [Xanthomonadaceae bacterium]|nr:DUF5698 domain-containing protein [Xanthomonadaceae bacterium]